MSDKCETCAGLGFVRVPHLHDSGFSVLPCPRCNRDSGYEAGEYEQRLIEEKGRCTFVKGGGGRVCIRYLGHPKSHVFQCGN